MKIDGLGDVVIQGMRIEYSGHLKNRLKLRKIDYDLPKKVFEQNEEKYFDQTTGHFIAIMKSKIYSKIKDVMVAYVIEEDVIRLLTIHPLKERQKENRIKSGRWRRSDERF